MAAETGQTTIDDNLNLLDATANPYPLYKKLRETEPVYWSEPMHQWLLTRYADCVTALRDQRLSSNWIAPYQERLPWLARVAMGPLFHSVSLIVLFKDGDEHMRLRGLMNKAFTPKLVQGMQPHIESIVNSLLDAAPASGELDIVRDIAYPLPTIVIAELLGAAPEDRALFKKSSDDIAGLLATSSPRPDKAVLAQLAMNRLMSYFHNLILERRKSPKDDLLSALIGAEERGDILSEEELSANLVNLLFAGHETTISLIGSAMLSLLHNPDQLQKLKSDPALMKTAIEEFLRFESPVQLTRRVAGEDIELNGKQIHKGELVAVILGAANRDPEQFPDPDRLDITRQENKHLAFSLSSHFCLGAPLARLEAQTAIGAMLERYTNLKLATDTPEWHETVALRSLKALPVTY